MPRVASWVLHTLRAAYPVTRPHRPGAEGGIYPLDWRALAPRQPDPDHVPEATASGVRYVNPVTVALYGLARHAEFVRDADPVARHAFLAQAQALVRYQDEQGGWSYPIPVRRYAVEAGWYSGMAQGLAISLFLRAAALTQNTGFIDAAAAAHRLMTRSTTDGGCALLDRTGRPFIEECPSRPPSMILNGALFALIGWIELDAGSATGAVERMIELLPGYDNGHWSRYDLRYGASASFAYHVLHISLLEAMAHLTGKPEPRSVAQRWARYARNPLSRAQAAVEKAAFAVGHVRT